MHWETKKMCVTHLITLFTLLLWSGTQMAISLRSACNKVAWNPFLAQLLVIQSPSNQVPLLKNNYRPARGKSGKYIKFIFAWLFVCFSFFTFWLKYTWFTVSCYFRVYSKVIQLHVFFQIIFYYRSLQDIEYNSLCSVVDLVVYVFYV